MLIGAFSQKTTAWKQITHNMLRSVPVNQHPVDMNQPTTSCVPGTVLGAGGTAVNVPHCLLSASF